MRATLRRYGLPIFSGVCAIAVESGAAITIYPGPSFVAGVGGYKPPSSKIIVRDGTAYAALNKYNASGSPVASAAFFWNSQGQLTFLDNLSTTAAGRFGSSPTVVTGNGAIYGVSVMYSPTGASLGQRPVGWSADGTTITQYPPLTTRPNGFFQGGIVAANSSGLLVGGAQLFDSADNYYGYRPVCWQVGSTSIEQLPVLNPASEDSSNVGAWDVNESGTIVGRCEVYDSSSGIPAGYHALRWAAGTHALTRLRALGEEPLTQPSGTYADFITNTGDVFGRSLKWRTDSQGNLTADGYRPVRWLPGSDLPLELGVLGEPPTFTRKEGMISDVNEGRIAVGYVSTTKIGSSALTEQAVKWLPDQSDATELARLPLPSGSTLAARALDVNESSNVVGWSNTFASDGVTIQKHAVMWSPDGSATDLNTLIDSSSGWILQSAESISEGNWIAGVGLFDPDGPGGAAAYDRLYLIQVPEPSALGSLAFVWIGCVRRSRAILA